MNYNNIADAVADILLYAVFIWLLGIIAIRTFLRPYRNILMRWYMTRFDKNYRAAKQTFNKLVYRRRVCERGATSKEDADRRFFEELLDDEMFKNMIGKELDGAEITHTDEDLLSNKVTTFRDVETFCCFFGRGIELHKIQVVFYFGVGIHLDSINLCYHEEDGKFFFFRQLEKREYPRDPGNRNRRKRVVAPTPALTVA